MSILGGSKTNAGSVYYDVHVNFDKAIVEVQTGSKKIEKTAAASSQEAGKKSGSKFTETFKSSFNTSIITKGLDKVFSVVKGSMDTAIERVDTLHNANKVFTAMGYSADGVSKSMDKLDEYLTGLPTSMTDAVQGVQRLAASFGGIEKGTEYFVAMNDAGLAFGATSDQISGAITQLSQLSLDGPLDAQTWNSLQNNGFGPVFAKMAEMSGMTVGELKSDFGGYGTKTVQDFLGMLIKLDTEGSGSMESLSTLARENTDGIGTAMENVQNRIGRALEKVFNAIGSENIAGAINAFSTGIVKVGEAISWVIDIIKNVVGFFAENEVARAALIGFLTAVVGVLGFQLIPTLTSLAVTLFTSVIPAFGAWAVALLTNPITLIIVGVTVLVGALILLLSHLDEVGRFFEEVFGHIGEFVGEVVKNIGDFFNGLFEGIGQGVKAVGDFFVGVWNGLVDAIKFIVGTIANVVGGIFKTIINAIIAFIEGFLNTPVDLINGVIEIVDAIIPGDQSGWRIPRIEFGRLATGGIVPATAGGQLILAGEGGQDEWVIPESKMASLIEQLNERGTGGGETYNIYVNGVFATSDLERRRVADQIVEAIEQNRRVRFI